MEQRWHEITFCHWPCPADVLQPLLPRGLSVDTMADTAWISITPFLLQGMRPPFFPRALGIDFPETNLRTYVQGPAGPGIWFFSLDAAREIAVTGARLLYGLPYFLANMEVRILGRQLSYLSYRERATVAILLERGLRINSPTDLDLFLTARYRLYSQRNSRLITAAVEHPPWQLNSVRILHFEEDLRKAAGLGGEDPPLLFHHSEGVDVKIGPPLNCAPHIPTYGSQRREVARR